MSYTSKKKPILSRAEREGNARQGYALTSFFASAEDIPAVVSDSLPDGKYCTVDDLLKGIRRVESHLLALHKGEGMHFAMVDLQSARSVVLTLVLADSSIGLSKEIDPAPFVATEHLSLKKRIDAIKAIVESAQDGSMSYEAVRTEFDRFPDAELTNTVVALLGQRVPVVQSMAGPLDLSMDKLPVKFVASVREHCLCGRVVGGYEEQAGTVVMEVETLKDADTRLFHVKHRITLRVMSDEHRFHLLLAQLAKAKIQVKVKVPRIPLTPNPKLMSELRCDLEDVEVLDSNESLNKIKDAIAHSLQLSLKLDD